MIIFAKIFPIKMMTIGLFYWKKYEKKHTDKNCGDKLTL
jgi:hypothetical protein